MPVVHKLALFETDDEGKALPEPCWIGNIGELRERNEGNRDVEDAIQSILDGATEAHIGGGAAPLVILAPWPEA